MLRYVTTFSADGYDRYGKAMIQGILDFWPDGEILAYYEGVCPPNDFNSPRVIFKDLFKVPGMMNFLEGASHFPIMQGATPDGKYVYMLDAFRFARKVFAQLDAATNYYGTLVWLDSDITTFQPIPESWVDHWIGGVNVAFMGRNEWHPCTSFLVWDCALARTLPFLEIFANTYAAGSVFTFPRWDDANVFFNLVTSLKDTPYGISAKNIAAHIKMDTGPVNVFDLVFKGRATHFKGMLKFGPRRYSQLVSMVRAMSPNRILEIGTWNGHRAIEMLQASPGSEYIGFDLFQDATPEDDKIGLNVKEHIAMEDVEKTLSGVTNRYRLYKGYSRDTLPKYIEDYGEHSADLIFIDGGHDVATIASDLAYAKRILEPGGLILLDDYYNGDIDTSKWGCNTVVENENYQLLCIEDPVVDSEVTKGVTVQMVCIGG